MYELQIALLAKMEVEMTKCIRLCLTNICRCTVML